MTTPGEGGEELAAPENEELNPTTEVEPAAPAEDAEAEPEAEPELTPEEEAELEFGMKKYKVPKSLKDDVEGWRAGQQKRDQEIAEERKALESERVEQSRVAKEVSQKRGQLAHAEYMISEFQKVDWDALEQENSQLAQTTFRKMEQWRIARDNLSQEVTQAERKSTDDAQQASAKRVQEALSELRRDIPNWSGPNGVGQKVAEFAMSELGYTAAELVGMADSRLGRALHRAMIGHQVMQKQAAARVKKLLPAAVSETPLQRVDARGGSPQSHRSLSELAKGEDLGPYIAARKAGRAA